MKVVSESITVKAPVAKVFEAFVRQIDAWWPRTGQARRYSFAPRDVEPGQILFEPRVGGRFYEVFANGEEFDIGRVTVYEPPAHFAFTWRDPDWNADTLVEVGFNEADGSTTVSLRHSGFENLEPGLAEGYSAGWQEIMQHLDIWMEEHVDA